MSYSFLKKFFMTAAAFAYMSPTAQAMPETININLKTSHYMTMNQTIKRIAVGNPSVATVIQLPGSASEFLIVTKETSGSTALYVWTADGARHEYLIIVSPEDPGRALLIEQAIGLPDVHVKMVEDRIMLTGTVENQYEKNYALQTARLFVNANSESSILVGSGFDMNLETQQATSSGSSGDLEATKSEAQGQIIDLLQIRHPTQIRLEAQIIEINSDNAKDLGLQYGTTGSGGIFSFGEDYTSRLHTTITESWTDSGSGSYNSGNSNTFSGNINDSYSGSRSNTYTGSQNNSYTGSQNNSFDSSRTNTYSGSRSDSYSGSNAPSDNASYSDAYSNSYGNSRNNNYANGYSNTYGDGYTNTYGNNRSGNYSDGYNNSYSGSGNNDFNNSLNQQFSRVITSSWSDMVQFSNNPLKWITQHFAPINATLNLLVTQNKARILSRPSVMTLSGEQATIQIGGKIPYTSINNNGGSNTQFEDYGIILQFKPVVDAQNRINSMIHAEVSNISGQAVNGQPIIATRRADSVINLSSGSPIVIGGLMDSSETKTVQKIPLLGDIPILGEFFKHTSKSRDKREIIIVVTPYLVGEDDLSRTPMSKPMREWFIEEQNYRQSMDNFDFTRPYEEPELVDETGEDDGRILPPSRINPKTGKLDKKDDDEPKEENAVFIAPEDAEDPFGK